MSNLVRSNPHSSLYPGPGVLGWWIVASSASILIVSAGLGFYAFGVFFTPLTQEFGWSRAEFSATISIAFVVTALASPLVGHFTDTLGARKVLISSAAVMGSTFLALAFTQTLWFYYLVFVFQAGSRAGAHVVPVTALIANWFEEKRGLALGLVATGISVGGVILTPVCTYLIGSFGWRMAYVVLGVLLWLTIIPVSIAVVRDRPGQLGLLPNGASKKTEDGKSSKLSAVKDVWTMGAALRTPTFWLCSVTVTLLFMSGSSVMTHTIPLLMDRGASAEEAALVMSFVAGMGIVGKLGSGFLADRLDVRFVAMFIGVLIALGMFLLVNFSRGPMVWLFAMVFGAGFGGVIALQSLLTAYCFGLASLGAILGGVALTSNLGFAVGPVLAGYIFDVTGSYNLAFELFIVGSILAVLVAYFVRPPKVELKVREQVA